MTDKKLRFRVNFLNVEHVTGGHNSLSAISFLPNEENKIQSALCVFHLFILILAFTVSGP